MDRVSSFLTKFSCLFGSFQDHGRFNFYDEGNWVQLGSIKKLLIFLKIKTSDVQFNRLVTQNEYFNLSMTKIVSIYCNNEGIATVIGE